MKVNILISPTPPKDKENNVEESYATTTETYPSIKNEGNNN